jgi:peptidyl-prolyl cis-trans isomerase B (cyclophilin B)
MKRSRLIALALVLGLAITAAPSVLASAKEPTKICTTVKSRPHPAASVLQPKKISKVLPKTFTFVTNCGDITIETVGDKAPNTLTALATLASRGFFNSSLCHRLTTQGLFVLQCGDPTATGTSGPVFNKRPWAGILDENLPVGEKMTYPAGTMAMANSGKDTNGSQFFFVYEDSALNPYYTVWGRITSGLDILRAIAAAGAAKQGQDGKYYYNGDGFPIQSVEIRRVIVR